MTDDELKPRNMAAALAQLAGSQRALRTVMLEMRALRTGRVLIWLSGVAFGVAVILVVLWFASRSQWERQFAREPGRRHA